MNQGTFTGIEDNEVSAGEHHHESAPDTAAPRANNRPRAVLVAGVYGDWKHGIYTRLREQLLERGSCAVIDPDIRLHKLGTQAGADLPERLRAKILRRSDQRLTRAIRELRDVSSALSSTIPPRRSNSSRRCASAITASEFWRSFHRPIPVPRPPSPWRLTIVVRLSNHFERSPAWPRLNGST
jgi:hypothetical protein